MNDLIKYADSGKSQTFRMSELPDVSVTVRGVVYFADENGFLALCDNPSEKSEKGYLCENAYLCDFDTFGPFIPESVNKAIQSIMCALNWMRTIDLDALDSDV